MTDQTTAQPLTDQQLDEIAGRAKAATRCPDAQANGRQDGKHTWTGSMTHLRCELCQYTRPRGERAEETAALLAEIRRLRADLGAAPAAAGEETAAEDTLPAWLYSRFINALDAPAWDLLTDDDRAYWEHQARAVRRAVVRGGFKTPAPAAAVVVAGDSGTNQ